MLSQACHAGEQKRATGDGFESGLWMRQADIPTPPVVDQRHRPGREIAAFHVLGGVAAPAPLIFEFVEAIFTIGAVAVELIAFAALAHIGDTAERPDGSAVGDWPPRPASFKARIHAEMQRRARVNPANTWRPNP